MMAEPRMLTAVCANPECGKRFSYLAPKGPKRLYCQPACRLSAGKQAEYEARSRLRRDTGSAKIESRGPNGERRHVNPATCDPEYDESEVEFLKAVDRYKRAAKRPFPTWSEVLEVLRSLGYRRVGEAGPLPGTKGPT